MKKIISILVALGLVLGLVLMATPAAATVSKATVAVVTNCAGAKATYNITFNVTASLTEGVHAIIIKFPAGTVIPTTPVPPGTVTIYEPGPVAHPVYGAEVSVSGQEVTVVAPVDIAVAATPLAPVTLTVEFLVTSGPPLAWGITNPPAGLYTLKVSTTRPPDSTPVASWPYRIRPAVSSYTFLADWGLSYPGINPDFWPPMKACGQNSTEVPSGAVQNTSMKTILGTTISGWLNAFNLTFTYIMPPGPPGCTAPCSTVSIWFELVSSPANATVTMFINGAWHTLGIPFPPYINFVDLGSHALTPGTVIGWPALIHVDKIGDYEICFHAECDVPAPCQPATFDKCYEFTAHQWKQYYAIDLYRKWNLISIPLVPFDPDIEAMLAAMHPLVRKDLLSIWTYDRCADTWQSYPGTLAELKDGPSYWMKFSYNATHTPGTLMPFAGGVPGFPLYVWGLELGEPPDPPPTYDVCTGWNMVGLTSLSCMQNQQYLWNFVHPTGFNYGLIYWWDAPTQTWMWMAPGTANMCPGFGNWIPFSVNGIIYP